MTTRADSANNRRLYIGRCAECDRKVRVRLPFTEDALGRAKWGRCRKCSGIVRMDKQAS